MYVPKSSNTISPKGMAVQMPIFVPVLIAPEVVPTAPKVVLIAPVVVLEAVADKEIRVILVSLVGMALSLRLHVGTRFIDDTKEASAACRKEALSTAEGRKKDTGGDIEIGAPVRGRHTPLEVIVEMTSYAVNTIKMSVEVLLPKSVRKWLSSGK